MSRTNQGEIMSVKAKKKAEAAYVVARTYSAGVHAALSGEEGP